MTPDNRTDAELADLFTVTGELSDACLEALAALLVDNYWRKTQTPPAEATAASGFLNSGTKE